MAICDRFDLLEGREQRMFSPLHLLSLSPGSSSIHGKIPYAFRRLIIAQ